MTGTPDDLVASTMTALADAYDQVVFLERAVRRAVGATHTADLVSLVEEAQDVMGARGSALTVGGTWLTRVPHWLRAQPRPDARTFTLSRPTGGEPPHLVAVPFEHGWVAFWGKPTPFTAGDVRLAETLAHLIASTEEALEARAERLRAEVEAHDRRTAAHVWRQVIPSTLKVPRGYAVASTLKPARDVGGDLLVTQGEWLVIADVSGKGVPAALFTGMLVSTLPLAVEHADLGAALARALHPYLEEVGMFTTLAALKLCPDGRVQYVNLGHPPVLVRHEDGEVRALPAHAPPLGTFALDRYPVSEFRLRPGELLCVYTDGLSEAERNAPDGERELFGVHRIEAHVAEHTEPGELHRVLTDAVRAWEVTDDFTLAVVQYLGDLPS
ncbi:PP2C family protein-serine/threonine phosphatase [Deinococcus pimensis]|uniref:PP2C family protein-serine/threonine phosphatase n=1 Tax=Deinococcus pimensis TaxID=309888 RepID=UPI000487DCDD|nr:PP2C family protein-serine/threonine phosphatase [Deinococcus pimensis]